MAPRSLTAQGLDPRQVSGAGIAGIKLHCTAPNYRGRRGINDNTGGLRRQYASWGNDLSTGKIREPGQIARG